MVSLSQDGSLRGWVFIRLATKQSCPTLLIPPFSLWTMTTFFLSHGTAAPWNLLFISITWNIRWKYTLPVPFPRFSISMGGRAGIWVFKRNTPLLHIILSLRNTVLGFTECRQSLDDINAKCSYKDQNRNEYSLELLWVCSLHSYSTFSSSANETQMNPYFDP